MSTLNSYLSRLRDGGSSSDDSDSGSDSEREDEVKATEARGKPHKPAEKASAAPSDAPSIATSTSQNHSEDSSVYGSKGYWEERYGEDAVVGESTTKGEVSNEWFVGYTALHASLEQHLRKDETCLLIGTGLSLLGEDMALDGYTNVVAMDYSEACIERMRQRQDEMRAATAHTSTTARVAYDVEDVTAMTYQDGSFASVLDKATLDTMFNMDDGLVSVHKMLAETIRVLAPGGKYICISYSEPDDRVHVLQDAAYAWELVHQAEVKKNKATFYVYVLVKSTSA